VTSALEHPSVLATVPALAGWGVESRVVARSAAGSLDPERFAEACDEHTAVVSVMTANNETGEIFPIPAVVEAVRRRSPRALVHTDAVQAFGKVPLSLEELGVDCMSMSAHKIGGLPGVGALILRKGVVLPPLIRGGPQEGGLRAGTENVPGLYALIVALEALLAGGAARHAAMRERREVVHGVVSAGIPDARCNFRHTPQLPNTLSVTIPGVLADDLVVALDLAGVAVSSGAACGSGKPEPSHVLLASGFSAEEARATVRISLGWELSLDEVRRGAELLVQCVTRMRVAQGRG
jgi:cysteine desulfurase